jgi:preprotein translocase subunit YajC
MTTYMNAFFLMAPPAGQSGGGATQILMLVMIFGVFYFFMIRPQMKKAKEAKKFREALSKGDKIITIGGIHGKITEVQESTFLIETEGGGRLRIEKSAVATGSADQLQPAK